MNWFKKRPEPGKELVERCDRENDAINDFLNSTPIGTCFYYLGQRMVICGFQESGYFWNRHFGGWCYNQGGVYARYYSEAQGEFRVQLFPPHELDAIFLLTIAVLPAMQGNNFHCPYEVINGH